MEILQDTIIKLVIRQGSDATRKQVVLTSGEQGFTTDTKRVYVGDGSIYGGHLVGNLFKGNIAGGNFNISSPVSGDLVFDTDTRKLYRNVISGSTSIGDWSQIGGVYISGDNKVAISNSNVITLNALSGGSLSPDIVQYPIVLSGGKISLPPLSAGTVSEDLLRYPIVLSGGKISLPPLSAGTLSDDIVQYPIVLNNGKIYLPPLSAGTVNADLVVFPLIVDFNNRIALSAQIPFEIVSTKTITISSGLLAYANDINHTGVPVNPLSSNLVIKSNELLIRFHGLSAEPTGTTYSRGISGIRVNTGDYLFRFGPLPTSQLYPSITIMGINNYIARTTFFDVSSLNVRVMSADNILPYTFTNVDAEIFLQISY